MNETETPGTTARDLEYALQHVAENGFGDLVDADSIIEDAARAHLAQLAPLPEGETERLAARADSNARAMAPPVPDVTVNGNYTVRAVLPGHPAGGGLLASWWVACKDPERGAWVTWEAYKMDGPRAGYLAYNAGHYFESQDPAENKREALADLAVRAGLMSEIGLRIADEVISRHPEHGPWNLIQKRERQLAGALRQWCQG